MTKKANNNIGYHLVAILTVAIWGSTFVFTKLLLLNGLSPAQIFTFRFIMAYVLLVGFALCQKRKFHWFANNKTNALVAMMVPKAFCIIINRKFYASFTN